MSYEWIYAIAEVIQKKGLFKKEKLITWACSYDKHEAIEIFDRLQMDFPNKQFRLIKKMGVYVN